MSIYSELLSRIERAYRDAGNGFHPPEAQQKINEALGAFRKPFEEIAAQIDRQRAGLYPSRQSYETATRDTLRLLEADLEVLRTAVAAAARADNLKISHTIVDQSVAVRKAKVQQSADGEMVRQVEKLIGQARDDARAAGELPPPRAG